MKITSVRMTAVSVPYRPEVGRIETAGTVLTGARDVIVEVFTDEGLVGLGEAVPRPSVYGETLESIATAVKELLVPPILGLSPFDVEQVWARWARVIGNNTAKSALDMALHDIIGQRAGVPLYRLLGGWTDGCIPLTMAIGLGTEQEMVSQAVQAVADGFRAVKLKVGKDLAADLRIVGAIRREIGAEKPLYVDPNEAYSIREAIHAIRKFEDQGVDLVEEPVPCWDAEGRALVADKVSVPLLLDESVKTPGDVLRELRNGTAGAMSIRSPRSGFTLSRRIMGLAEAGNVACLVGSHRELGVATVASAHLAAAYRLMKYPAELGVYTVLQDDVLTERLTIRDGELHLPSGSGLGVTLDPEKMLRYQLWQNSIV